MRLIELIALTTIGALFGGAYLLGYHPWVFGLEQPTTDIALSDAHYVVMHRTYFTGVLAMIVAATAIYVIVLAFGSTRTRILGAISLIIGSLGLFLAAWPQHFLPRQGMPRRYIDYPAAFERWNMLSSLGSFLAASGALLLISVALFCLWQRIFIRTA